METIFDIEKSKQFVSMKDNDPIVKFIQEYSLLHYIGNVKDKRVLDIGCGNGLYSRLLKRNGAKEVVGVDLSEAMIELAKADEEKEPLGIKYFVKDARSMGKIGDFDLILVNFLLVFATSVEELRSFVKTCCENLVEGGFYVGANPNCLSNTWYKGLEKYGKTFEKLFDIPRGVCVRSTWSVPGQAKDMSVIHYNYEREVYEEVFQAAGFRKLSFEKVLLSEEGKTSFPRGYWDDYMNNSNQIIFVGQK